MAKKSVYFGAPIDQLLARTGAGNVSGALNAAVAHYLAIMDAHRPDLSHGEWLAVCDVLNATAIDEAWTRRAARYLAIEVEEGLVDGLAEKWEIDGPALVAKLAALDTAGALAVLHVAETFWAHCDLAPADALALAGVR
jgi:hypothetical protein